MMPTVVELQVQDDLASIQHRVSWMGGGRVALVVPWEMPFLSRPLDFDLLRREAERWRLEVAIISADPERRSLAHECGFPAFASVAEAQRAKKWPVRPSRPVEPPPRHWWDADIDLRPRPVRRIGSWFNWVRLGFRFVVFLLALAVLVGSAYVVVPTSTVTLVPASREFSVIVPVSVDLGVEAVDHEARLIPARRVGVEIGGHAETETTGLMNLVAGRATGEVIFTNLLAQDYVVPAGTVVRTSSSSYPIRFRTTRDVAVSAGGRATAPIEALEDGVGNVGAFQINQVEGVASSAVAVINPEQTTGAEPRETRVVVQADYDRLRSMLMQQLLGEAYEAMSHLSLLEPTEFILRQSLRVEAVPKLAYDRFVTEEADRVGLDMRILVSGWAVDVDNAEGVAYQALVNHMPPGYTLMEARYEVGELAEEDVGPGAFTFFVTAHGYTDVALDEGVARSLVIGLPLDEARERLTTELPLAEEPQITLWPEWPEELKRLERMPLLPARIDVQVVSRIRPAAQSARGD